MIMKKLTIKFLHAPKIAITLVLIAALGVAYYYHDKLGNPPIVNVPESISAQKQTAPNTGGAVDLAFLRTGRLATLAVKQGDLVKQGDVLATLDAQDALGTLNQAKGALELAKAQYASLDIQYSNAKQQQDVLVENAHRTLLSSGLTAIAVEPENKTRTQPVDNSQAPTMTGTYTCGKEGQYRVSPYRSSAATGYTLNFSGLESGTTAMTYHTPQALGSCGLFIQFPEGYSETNIDWVIDIPNTKSSGYAQNKNAYDLALATREQVLKQLEANLGKDGSSDANIAKAAVDAAQGAYDAALANYQNASLVAPASGVVTYVDNHLNVGETVTQNKTVITIITK